MWQQRLPVSYLNRAGNIFGMYLQFQKEVHEKNYRRVTTRADSQKQIKQNIFYEIKHMSLNFKHGLMIRKLQHNTHKISESKPIIIQIVPLHARK